MCLEYAWKATVSPGSSSCQIASGALANCHFLLSPKIFKWLQVQVLVEPLWHLFQIQSIILRVCCRKSYHLSCSARFVIGSICAMGPTSCCSVLTPGDSHVISRTWFLPVAMFGFQTWDLNVCLIEWDLVHSSWIYHMPVCSEEWNGSNGVL